MTNCVHSRASKSANSHASAFPPSPLSVTLKKAELGVRSILRWSSPIQAKLAPTIGSSLQ